MLTPEDLGYWLESLTHGRCPKHSELSAAAADACTPSATPDDELFAREAPAPSR